MHVCMTCTHIQTLTTPLRRANAWSAYAPKSQENKRCLKT